MTQTLQSQDTAVTERSGRLRRIAAIGLFLLGFAVVAQGGLAIDPAAWLVRLILAGTVLAQAGLLVGLWWVAAAGWGEPVRWMDRAGGMRWPERVAIGAGLQMLAVWLIGWAGWLNVWGAWAVAAVGFALLAWRMVRGGGMQRLMSDHPWPAIPWPAVAAAPAVGLLVGCTALAPAALWDGEHRAYDALSYHLQLPKEWIAAGAIEGLKHNVFSYLPNLVETAYAQIGLWRGSMVDGAYTAQLLHATMALMAAAIIWRIVAAFATAAAGAAAAAVYLATPWTLVTGVIAYNEQGVVMLGAAALAVVLTGSQPGPQPAGAESEIASGAEASATELRRALLAAMVVGLTVGLATLAKLTAAGMVAAPIALAWLLRGAGSGRWPWRRRALEAAGLALGAGLVVGLWLVRNGLWTGNPTFPMFAGLFGSGHWSAEQAQRWQAATRPEASPVEMAAALWRELIAHYQFAYIVIPAALAAAALLLTAVRRRTEIAAGIARVGGVAGLMLMIIALQLGFWAGFTHHQSRFLVPVLLPACVLIGLALATAKRRGWNRSATAAGGILILWPTLLAAILYVSQLGVPAPAFIGGTDLWAARPASQGLQPMPSAVNGLSQSARIYAEAYATPFYIDRPITYHTVWDTSPLGDALASGGPEAALRWLRDNSYTHMLIDWEMFERWNQPDNYGYDPDVQPAALQSLADQHLRPVHRTPGKTLYRIPPR